MKKREPHYASGAWLLRGISSVPGVLKLSKGRLSFTAEGFGTLWKWQWRNLERVARQPGLADRMDNGAKALIFDRPLLEVAVTFPWYYFTGGLKVRVDGVTYRLSFGRPSNTHTGAGDEMREVGKMRRVGRHWKTVLTDQAATR